MKSKERVGWEEKKREHSEEERRKQGNEKQSERRVRGGYKQIGEKQDSRKYEKYQTKKKE